MPADVPTLSSYVRLDGAWLRCLDCSKAYWGAFRPAEVVLAKAQKHQTKAHGAKGAAAPDAELRKAKARVEVFCPKPAKPKAERGPAWLSSACIHGVAIDRSCPECIAPSDLIDQAAYDIQAELEVRR
jgi:hypothetical protein